MKTPEEFNEKWKSHLEEGHYGMAINNEKVIEYMDKEFAEEEKINPDFTYSQIKLKFNSPRVYVESSNVLLWEREINKILNNE